VFGRSLRINPLLVIFALLLGAHLQGVIGALLALPLAAVARETLLYLRRHLVMEPWGTPSAATLRARPTDPTAPERAAPEAPAWSVRAAGALGDRWSRWRGRRSRPRRLEPEQPVTAPHDPDLG
jgi:hypothetical protein